MQEQNNKQEIDICRMRFIFDIEVKQVFDGQDPQNLLFCRQIYVSMLLFAGNRFWLSH